MPGPLADPDDGRVVQPLIDVYEVAFVLRAASGRLLEPLQALPAEAPPAFLLDGKRRSGRRPEPGAFDNRSWRVSARRAKLASFMIDCRATAAACALLGQSYARASHTAVHHPHLAE